VERAKDGSGMAGIRSIDSSMCERTLDLLEVGYLRLRKVVVKTITVKFGVNDGCGSGRGCFGIEIRAETADLTNMIIAVFGER